MEEKQIRKALENFALTFATFDPYDGTYWGHNVNLGECKKEFKLVEKRIQAFLDKQIKN